jgi:glycine/D-amino acid oxidase-like deaminating enzyme
MVGQDTAEIVTGAERAAREHRLTLESLTAREIRRRYPMLRVHDNERGVFEPEGGVLDPERSVETLIQAAATAGAELHFGLAMEKWEASEDGIVIRLADGSAVKSRALVLSLGAWFKAALEKLGVAIRVQRNVQVWFTPATNQFAAGRMPAFLLERAGLPAPLYGFPDFGDGVKAAFHAHGDLTDAAHLKREIDPTRDIEPVAQAMEQWMPGAAASFRAAKPCPYTLTPDGHFVIDRHPQHSRLILCGGFSGHGFKFAPVVGEICTSLALEEEPRYEIDFLSLRRFTGCVPNE